MYMYSLVSGAFITSNHPTTHYYASLLLTPKLTQSFWWLLTIVLWHLIWICKHARFAKVSNTNYWILRNFLFTLKQGFCSFFFGNETLYCKSHWISNLQYLRFNIRAFYSTLVSFLCKRIWICSFVWTIPLSLISFILLMSG